MEVIWTQEAENKYRYILQFIQESFGSKAADNFIDTILKFNENILEHPHFYPTSDIDKNYHRAVIHKRLIIYYFVDNNMIVVSSLKDTRMAHDSNDLK